MGNEVSNKNRMYFWFPLLLICALGIIVYSNTLHVPFYLDDVFGISKNPVIKDLHNFAEPSILLSNRVVGMFTFALNYAVHGSDVTGYHVVNILIHICNAFLVYWLVLLTFQTPFIVRSPLPVRPADVKNHDGATNLSALPVPNLIALCSALFFIAHPVQTQAVTYTIQRFTSLAAFFMLLSLVSYIMARSAAVTSRRIAFTVLSFISTVLAMKTKEIAFTLPVLIICYDLLFFRGGLKTRAAWFIPLLLTMLIIPLSLTGLTGTSLELVTRASEASRVETDLSRIDYILTQFRVIVTYIRLLLLPVNQMLDYDYPIYHTFRDPAVSGSFLYLLSLIGLAGYGIIVSRTRYRFLRLIAFGILWFFIALSVESSFIPIIDVIFEHRVYLPSVGFLIALNTALVGGIEALFGNTRRSVQATRAVLVLLASGIVIFSIATFQRNNLWGDSLAFWEDALGKSPNKGRVYSCLGNAWMDRGRTDKAIENFTKAVALQPEYVYGRINLGFAYFSLRLYDDAIVQYEEVLRLNPNNAETHLNLSIAYRKKGWNDKAEKHRTLAKEANKDIFNFRQ